MIKDYNYNMLNALHSIFWYDGLLDQENEEWVDYTDKEGDICSRPKYDANCVILKLIDELRNKRTKYTYYTLDDVLELDNQFQSPYEFNVIWMMLVEMFGNCGTSPRTGWIEKRGECAEFLEQVVYLQELK